MPIYEYNCCDCKKEFEELASILKEKENPCCPGCGSKNTQKIVSPVQKHKSEGGSGESSGPADSGCAGSGGFA